MNKYYYSFCCILLFCVFGKTTFAQSCNGSNYEASDMMNITETGQDFDYEFTDTPPPTTGGSLTFCVIGDFGFGSSESATLFDEDGQELATVGPVGADCPPEPTCITLDIPLSTLSTWTSDGKVEFLVDNNTGVNSFCATEFNSLELTYRCGAIPTMGQWGIFILGMMLSGMGLVQLYRTRVAKV